MELDRRAIKLEARNRMREHRPSVFLIALVFIAVIYILDSLGTRLQFPGVSLQELREAVFHQDPVQLLRIMSRRNAVSELLVFALSVMSSVVSAGFAGVCLSVSRRQETGVAELFDTFGIFFKVFWLSVVTGVFIFLWSLLLVIPGIIAAYRYSMALFVLLDDPDKSVLQCIRESGALTRGHKWELFVLDLSFLGWDLLSMIPLVRIYTEPYMTLTRAMYYNALSGYRPEEVWAAENEYRQW